MQAMQGERINNPPSNILDPNYKNSSRQLFDKSNVAPID